MTAERARQADEAFRQTRQELEERESARLERATASEIQNRQAARELATEREARISRQEDAAAAAQRARDENLRSYHEGQLRVQQGRLDLMREQQEVGGGMTPGQRSSEFWRLRGAIENEFQPLLKAELDRIVGLSPEEIERRMFERELGIDRGTRIAIWNRAVQQVVDKGILTSAQAQQFINNAASTVDEIAARSGPAQLGTDLDTTTGLPMQPMNVPLAGQEGGVDDLFGDTGIPQIQAFTDPRSRLMIEQYLSLLQPSDTTEGQ
jgi:hypothetical protein